MPRILAIDWDRHELRALLLQSGATGTSVAGAWAAPLTSDQETLPASRVGACLATVLAGQSLGKVTTIVGVGRDHVQMKLLSLPPAPPEELPDLVRFQAEREFTALGDRSTLDYLTLGGDAQTPYQVLAAALGAVGMNEVHEVCQAIDVEPDHVTLRACAAASYVRRAALIEEVALVISPLIDEADLTVLDGGRVVLMRTVRLPHEEQTVERQRALAGEIRRTLAAVGHQLTGRQVDRAYLCGSAHSADQPDPLAIELELPVERFDPVAHAPSGFDRTGVVGTAGQRFASVLGMALDEAVRQPPVIDFLHVRRRAKRGRFGRVHALAAAAVVISAMALGVHFWYEAAAPARERQMVLADLQHLEPIVQQYQDVSSRAALIEQWLATDVNWLDELQRFSQGVRPDALTSSEFPVDQDVVVRQLTLLRPAGNDARGGLIDVDAAAKRSATVATIEERLRDERHRVASGGVQQDHAVPGYDWSFKLGVTVAPPEDADQEGTTP